MNNELIKVTYGENDTPTVSARELHEFLDVDTKYNDWFPRMCDYGFENGRDFNLLKNEKVQQEGNRMVSRLVDDAILTIEMAKEIAMLQRSDKGKQARTYFIHLEKAWNTPEMVMARALKMADKQISKLETTVKVLDIENNLLSTKTLKWADRKFINAAVRQYAGNACDGSFADAWINFKKELLYKHSINLNSRITKYLNETGKKTKPQTLEMLDDSEVSSAVSTIVALCRENNVDISDLIKKVSDVA